MTEIPDFVVVGHVVEDLADGGVRLGGTATFAAIQAQRLGLSVGVVTRCSAATDLSELDFAQVVRGVSLHTTEFSNVYLPEGREQRILRLATPIEGGDVPEGWWGAPIVLLGPVFHEVPGAMAASFTASGLLGVSAQGWLRAKDAEGRVQQARWRGESFWRGAGVMFASDEDLGGDASQLDRWVAEVPVVAVTRSLRGARVWEGGRMRQMEAFPQEEVDATGAGDTFAAAFLVRFRETEDVGESARFGAAAASLSVGGIGAAAIAGREAVEGRMRRHPEIRLI
jgi:hypothetical protein